MIGKRTAKLQLIKPEEMPSRILDELDAKSRGPFRRRLAVCLETFPTPEALQAFANKHPDRHAQTLAILARLSGFSDKIEIDARLALDLHSMSDAELYQRHFESLADSLRGAPPDCRRALLAELTTKPDAHGSCET